MHQSQGPNISESEKISYLERARLGGTFVFKNRNKGMRIEMNI